MSYLTKEEKRRLYNRAYYKRNKEEILIKNRAWSKKQRVSRDEHERYRLMVNTNLEKYGKDYYKKIGKISGDKFLARHLVAMNKAKKKMNLGFDDKIDDIMDRIMGRIPG